jgi:hypothetical protein
MGNGDDGDDGDERAVTAMTTMSVRWQGGQVPAFGAPAGS